MQTDDEPEEAIVPVNLPDIIMAKFRPVEAAKEADYFYTSADIRAILITATGCDISINDIYTTMHQLTFKCNSEDMWMLGEVE